MDLPQDLKHLFINWLEEECVKAVKLGTKSAMLYSKALARLRDSPNIISSPKQLLEIQFFGPKIVERLTSKLNKYCQENGYNIPAIAVKEKATDYQSDEEGAAVKKKKSNRKYIPARRSGGYAILLALLEHDPHLKGLMKEDIQRYASPHCDKSFHANPSTSQFYSAWNSHKTLVSRDLLKFSGRPVYYFLTEEGLQLAKTLKRTNDIESGKVPLHKHDIVEYLSSPETNKWGKRRMSEDIIDEEEKDYAPDNVHAGHGYSIWEPGSFQVEFIVDNREIRSQQQRDYFPRKLAELDLNVSVRPLSVGDGLWIAKNKETNKEAVLNFILERKRLDDLVSSIQDGRHMEQKLRLKKTGIQNVFYVIEEQMSSDVSRMSDAIQTAIAMTITTSKFFVKRTKDADETIAFLARMTKEVEKLYQHKKLIVLEPKNVQSQSDFSAIMDRFRSQFGTEHEYGYNMDAFQSVLSKTALVSIREMFIRMLMTIKGVSLDKAIVIQRRFPTPDELIKAYMNCPEEEKRKLLSKVFSQEVGNRKIGPALSTKIYEIWGKGV